MLLPILIWVNKWWNLEHVWDPQRWKEFNEKISGEMRKISEYVKWENSGRKKLVIIWVKKVLKVFNALTPMSDQHRISPYNIITISSR